MLQGRWPWLDYDRTFGAPAEDRCQGRWPWLNYDRAPWCCNLAVPHLVLVEIRKKTAVYIRARPSE